MTISTDPAFPLSTGQINSRRYGLTKREYFAIRILAAMCGNLAISHNTPSQEMAHVAVVQADALSEMLELSAAEIKAQHFVSVETKWNEDKELDELRSEYYRGVETMSDEGGGDDN